MPHGVVEGAAKELCYWSTGNGDDTMVTLWNPADEPQDLSFTLFYTGGQYVYPIHLGPRETAGGRQVAGSNDFGCRILHGFGEGCGF